MKNASIKQKKTEQFIKQVREEYQLPIKRSSKGIGAENRSQTLN